MVAVWKYNYGMFNHKVLVREINKIIQIPLVMKLKSSLNGSGHQHDRVVLPLPVISIRNSISRSPVSAVHPLCVESQSPPGLHMNSAHLNPMQLFKWPIQQLNLDHRCKWSFVLNFQYYFFSPTNIRMQKFFIRGKTCSNCNCSKTWTEFADISRVFSSCSRCRSEYPECGSERKGGDHNYEYCAACQCTFLRDSTSSHLKTMKHKKNAGTRH